MLINNTFSDMLIGVLLVSIRDHYKNHRPGDMLSIERLRR